MKPKLVIWGASGHARVVADIVQLAGEYELAGFLDDVHPERRGETFFGSTILGGREQLPKLRESGIEYLIFGFGNPVAKLKLVDELSAAGFKFASAVHPHASLASNTSLGSGVVVKAGAVLDMDVQIDDHVNIGANVTLGHGSKVGTATLISAGSNLAGNVTVGKAAFIGVGASVRNRIGIGEHAVIGAGAVVLRDIPDRVVAFGVPARIVRRVDAADE